MEAPAALLGIAAALSLIFAGVCRGGQAISRATTVVMAPTEAPVAFSRAFTVVTASTGPSEAFSRALTLSVGPSIPGQAISRAVTVGEACMGDSDRSSTVDFGDVTSVLSNWLTEYEGLSGPGDANFDGRVDFADLTTVLSSWLQSCN